jgi:integrase
MSESIYGEMKQWLQMAQAESRMCPWVFQRQEEQMVFNWRTWHCLCKLAGVPKLLFHDLRRTALTNMVHAGIPEKMAMEITGHRTRKAFERYHIVSDRDIREVGQKVEMHLLGLEAGTIMGTVGHSPESKLLN